MQSIETRNALFAAATPEGKRVLIATDVLAAIALKKIAPQAGVYLNKGAAQGAGKETSCQACAIGSLFVCLVNQPELKLNLEDARYTHEAYDGGRNFDDDRMRDKLAPYFDRQQLGLIEAAFEADTCFAEDAGCEWEDGEAAAEFAVGEKDDEARLVKIMQNIVANNGTFVV